MAENPGTDGKSTAGRPAAKLQKLFQKIAKNLLQNFAKKNLFYLILRIDLEDFVSDCLRKHLFISDLVQTR